MCKCTNNAKLTVEQRNEELCEAYKNYYCVMKELDDLAEEYAEKYCALVESVEGTVRDAQNALFKAIANEQKAEECCRKEEELLISDMVDIINDLLFGV